MLAAWDFSGILRYRDGTKRQRRVKQSCDGQMAKPTTPFGTIDFGRDGCVRRNIHVLSPDKAEQEIEVGRRFVRYAEEMVGGPLQIEPLDERDHDFRLFSDSIKIDVQCTEVVRHDFLKPPHIVDTYFIKMPDGSTRSVDEAKLDETLTNKIRRKFEKHYTHPPDGELWLLIWSVAGLPHGAYIDGDDNTRKVSRAVARAQAFLNEVGPAPFDRILFFDLLTRPTQISPPDERW